MVTRRMHPAILIMFEVVIAILFFIAFYHLVLPALFDLIGSFSEVLGALTISSYSHWEVSNLLGRHPT